MNTALNVPIFPQADVHVEIAPGSLAECFSHRDFAITSRREAFANDAALGRDLARENSKEMC